MARYVLLRYDRNEAADKAIGKFHTKEGVEVLGLFASATKFCPGKSVCGEGRKYVRSRTWGLTYCSICKLPVSSTAQYPRNLLNPVDLHPRLIDISLSVWEPYEPPVKKYGQKAIDRLKAQAGVGRKRMERYWARKAREEKK